MLAILFTFHRFILTLGILNRIVYKTYKSVQESMEDITFSPMHLYCAKILSEEVKLCGAKSQVLTS